ncbi:DUF4258 domain-containing protein [Streptomyces globisporus]|uniref:DUF4258 domain-containing protein n=1 Tax=Streptomyces globisporus TaxID=1908 RepID=UPI00379285FF
MILTYTNHARRRMRQRRVAESDIENALSNYSERITTPKNSIRYRGPGLSGAILKVWVVPDAAPSSDKIIKSVAWDGVDDD